MQKSLFKLFLSFVKLFAFAWLGLSFIGSLFLSSQFPKLQRQFSKNFDGYQLRCNVLLYSFPNHLLGVGVRLADPSDPKDHILSMPILAGQISSAASWREHSLSVQAITCIYPRSSLTTLSKFLEKNRDALLAWFKNIPSGNISIRIFSASTLEPAEMPLGPISGKFQLKGQGFQGVLRLPEKSQSVFESILSPTQEMKIITKGQLEKNGVIFEKIEISKKNFHLQFWGDIEKQAIRFQGFGLIELADQGHARSPLTRWDFVQFLTGNERKSATPINSLGSASSNILYLLDVSGAAQLDLPKIKVTKLDFLLNHFFISSTGRIQLTRGVPAEFDVLVTPKRKGEGLSLGQARMTIRTLFEPETTILGLTGQAIYVEPIGKEERNHSVRFDFPMIRLYARNGLTWQVAAENSTAYFSIGGEENRVMLSKITGQLGWIAGKNFFSELVASEYGGKFSARFWSGERGREMVPTAFLQAQHIDLRSLSSEIPSLHYFDGGLLSSKIYFRPGQQEWVSGRGEIEGGLLQNISFFDWAAKNFSLPQLKVIAFSRVSAQISGTAQGVGFPRFTVEGQGVKIFGGYFLKQNGLVGGTVSLEFARSLLEQSSRLSSLMSISPPEEKKFLFDFKFSGLSDSPNFQWLPSSLKTRIQTIIPDFIERRIETGVEKAIAPL